MLFLQNAQTQALTLSQTLDTRSRYFASGSDAYLVRNLHNTHMERYGILIPWPENGYHPETDSH